MYEVEKRFVSHAGSILPVKEGNVLIEVGKENLVFDVKEEVEQLLHSHADAPPRLLLSPCHRTLCTNAEITGLALWWPSEQRCRVSDLMVFVKSEEVQRLQALDLLQSTAGCMTKSSCCNVCPSAARVVALQHPTI